MVDAQVVVDDDDDDCEVLCKKDVYDELCGFNLVHGDNKLDKVVCELFDVSYNSIYAFHVAQKPIEKVLENMEVGMAEKTEANGETQNPKFLRQGEACLSEQCTRKDAPIRSSTGIEVGLGEHLVLMERPIRSQLEIRAGLECGLLISASHGHAKIVPGDVAAVEILISARKELFWVRDVFATDVRRFDEGVFIGNLRKPIKEVMPKLEDKLSKVARSEVVLWFIV
uniref:Probable zinc metallopeptidase EGY3, chloroplastic n=1 Tax=Tanacetum cinerariifolium TaxID=118510 RepID=A0A6L2J2S9_TANCI|nr:probable zinc metallopeptidase EGY3, chloroplastic [Tanacetum cinerariifolium]